MKEKDPHLDGVIAKAITYFSSHDQVCYAYLDKLSETNVPEGDPRYEDIATVRLAIWEMTKIIVDFTAGEIDARTTFHDLNNIRSVTSMFLDFIIEEENKKDDDPAPFLDERTVYLEEMKEEMREIYLDLRAALNATAANFDIKYFNNVELPEGTSTLMIDDDAQVNDAFERLFSEKNFTDGKLKFTSVSDEAGLDQWIADEQTTAPDYIILDDRIGETLRGYELLEKLRTTFPNASIVVHTANREILEAKEETPYGALPVAAKLDLSAIQSGLTCLQSKKT